MSVHHPKVSVLIPVYNRERYVGAAVDSILAQSLSDYEILLIDDGSTDRSLDVMQAYTDPRVRVVCNERNLGIPRTRNIGLQLAHGEYIALLDSDDVAHPQRLEKQVAFLDRHPDYAQIGSWERTMDEQGQALKKTKRRPVAAEDVHVQLLFQCSQGNPTVMARTAILREYGYHTDYPSCEDYELYVRLAKRYKLGNLPEVLVYTRAHPHQISKQLPESRELQKRRIISGQLTELGVAFEESDLVSHLNLYRMRRLGGIPDRTYPKWAEAWLLRLKAANQQTLCYTEPALTRAVNEYWFRACRAAQAGMGWAAWRYFLKSPLRRGIGSRLKQAVRASL